MQKKSFSISWGDSSLEMLPSKALLLPQTNELLICDIHLGKAEYFQQNGIPLTNNSDEQNLLSIKKIVENYKPYKLIILGDLFHSKYSIYKNLQKKVDDLPELLKTNVELVLGNHDVGCNIKKEFSYFIENKNLEEDLENAINFSELTKRRFKNIAQISGLA